MIGLVGHIQSLLYFFFLLCFLKPFTIVKTILSTGAIHKQAYGRIWPEGPGLWISDLSNCSIAQVEKLRSKEFQYICPRSRSGQDCHSYSDLTPGQFCLQN